MRIVASVLAILIVGGAAGAQKNDSLRPGLVATYRDTARPKPVEITQTESGIGLTLKKGEAPHPRLSADGGIYRWEGLLKISRGGEYQFSAIVQGKLRLTVAGKDVVSVASRTDDVQTGSKIRLDAGTHPLRAEFIRAAGDARVSVQWESTLFRREPLPFDVLAHAADKAPEALVRDRRSEHGRFLAEERNCTQCHRPGDGEKLAEGLGQRFGPDLSKVGARTAPGWMYRWLASPRAISSTAIMPEMFDADEAGRTEIYAVTRYLAMLGGPLKHDKTVKDEERVRRGQQLFSTVGCSACHAPAKDKRPPAGIFPRDALGRKTTAVRLAEYLRDPLTFDPSGRMPSLLLDAKEANDLAHYLCGEGVPDVNLPAAPPKEQVAAAFKRVDPRPDELKDFLKLGAEQQWLDLGKRIVIARGCNNCHTIAPDGQPFANVLADSAFEDLREEKRIHSGCLSADKSKRGKAPWFGWSTAEVDALRLFVREGSKGAGSPAPPHQARVALERFNCLACHARAGAGGLSAELIESLLKAQNADHAEAVSPPPLTGIGDKLRTPWLRKVLLDSGRARPWLAMRMPQFGKDNLGTLAETLAALDGTRPDDALHKVAMSPALLDAGRALVGKTGFNCVACHDLAGQPGTTTRGPDLASMTQRIRYDWYRRWLEQPLRMQPGTRMPAVFPDGKSLQSTVLDGDVAKQANAMWGYLAQGKKLPQQ